MKEERFWELFHKNGDKDFGDDPDLPPPEKYLFKTDAYSAIISLLTVICAKLEIDPKPILEKHYKTWDEQVGNCR